MNNFINRPTSAFIAASWVALLAGAVGFMIGLWNANMPLHEKATIWSFYSMVYFLPPHCRKPFVINWRKLLLPQFTMVCAGYPWQSVSCCY